MDNRIIPLKRELYGESSEKFETHKGGKHCSPKWRGDGMLTELTVVRSSYFTRFHHVPPKVHDRFDN